MQEREHQSPQKGLLWSNDQGGAILHGKVPNEKADDGLYEGVGAPRPIYDVHRHSQGKAQERPSAAPPPKGVPAEEKQDRVRIRAEDAETTEDQPLQPEDPGCG